MRNAHDKQTLMNLLDDMVSGNSSSPAAKALPDDDVCGDHAASQSTSVEHNSNLSVTPTLKRVVFKYQSGDVTLSSQAVPELAPIPTDPLNSKFQRIPTISINSEIPKFDKAIHKHGLQTYTEDHKPLLYHPQEYESPFEPAQLPDFKDGRRMKRERKIRFKD